jgi:hypothetical protein
MKFLFIHDEQSTEPQLKSKLSLRKIPSHPRIVELGDLEFVKLRRNQGMAKLSTSLQEKWPINLHKPLGENSASPAPFKRK